MQKFQQQWDSKHFSSYRPSQEDALLFLSAALCGEAGEIANLVKKLWREKKWSKVVEKDQARHYVEEVKDELADVLIYLLIIANRLEVDLEKLYLEKNKINEERFKDKK